MAKVRQSRAGWAAPSRTLCQPGVVQVLLVEDDDAIAEPLRRGLEREGFTVERVASGSDGLDAATRDPGPDLILLDLGLPDLDGYEVCRRLRTTSEVPIIVITARGDEVDRVIGLELGADDYVVKPFGFRELVARIRAVSRRSVGNDASSEQRMVLPVGGGIELDTRTRKVTRHDQELNLTRKEFDLLALLARDPGATLTRDQILEQVWDAHWYGSTKTLDVHVAALRRKLGDPALIETVRGVGFRLREPS